MSSVLRVDSISKQYRGVKAVDDISLELGRGEVLGLIGPNGAGKTTLLNLVTGYVRADAGSMELVGRSSGRASAAAWARRGITRTFQAPYIYEDASIVENVRRAAYSRQRQSILRQLMTRRESGSLFEEMTAVALETLEVVGLPTDLADGEASSLPYGHRKLLSLAMVLATGPEVVCLDEPAAGLNPEEKENIIRIIGVLRGRGMSVVLVEHDMSIVSQACDRTIVLNYGRCIAEGTTSDVLDDPEVARAYLGGVSADG
ncbi:ABC transporter ATP-binding protein [Pseudactinotalea sp.]|uniref:ABC transporter ATP-binding protein n=1 Tax=Pseudactinotalea sp. TaxID=1926260 RepID=UPI003B3B64F3